MTFTSLSVDEFLAKGLEPEKLTLSAMESLAGGSGNRSHLSTLCKAHFMSSMLSDAASNVPGAALGVCDWSNSVDWWSEAVGKSFFAPGTLPGLCHLNATLPAASVGKAQDLSGKLGGLVDKVVPCRDLSSSPFLIMNGSVMVGGELGCLPLEFTPLYFGLPVSYQSGDVKINAVMVEPAGWCHTGPAAAVSPPVGSGQAAVASVTVSRLVSIHEQSGVSSSNIAQTHGDTMSSDAYKRAQMPEFQCYGNGVLRCVDGGSTDNTGILALLRRSVQNVLACLACNLPVSDPGVGDANAHSLGTLAGLFGVQKSASGEVDSVKDKEYNAQRAVLPASAWDELIAAMRARLQQGQTPVHTLRVPVASNALAGVRGGYTLTLTVVLSTECKAFVDRLPAETRQQIEKDKATAGAGGVIQSASNSLQGVGLLAANLATYPYVPVAHLRYSPALAGLMSQQARWTLAQHADDLRALARGGAV